ncbi:glycosyltransferase family 4 protein [Crateriforma spongiae]|uniref:glycosyltransferase family 4 protein n=1 Tax=Crateriforma spongiae TaxID=2724528 RepID=UPI00144807E2|nr:glycosyltransferase family 4 protein [Crateriforma spongiae]
MTDLATSPAPPDRPTVAIVAWQAIGTVAPGAGVPVGGMETAAWTFATGLARDERWRPIFVARSTRRLPNTHPTGVTIAAHVDRWMPVRRAVASALSDRPVRWTPRLIWQVFCLAITKPFRAADPMLRKPDPRLAKLDPPDVWITMGVNAESAGVIATAGDQQRPSLVLVQSNEDLNPRFADDPHFTSKYGVQSADVMFAIRNATHFVCQNQWQCDQLQKHFGRDSFLIRNAIDLHHFNQLRERFGPTSPRDDESNASSTLPFDQRPVDVLWIGRFENFHKRITTAIQIARQSPSLKFCFIANPSDPAVEADVLADPPDNVRFISRVPAKEMPNQFAQAKTFLCTGDPRYEGFPNVLLQAAAMGTPIVSLADFDQFFQRSGAGVVCDDPRNVPEVLSEFVTRRRSVDHSKVYDYLETHHSEPVICRHLADLLDRCLDDVR